MSSVAKIYVVGIAGSGKSTLAKTFKDWLLMNNWDGIIINLDPGCEFLPYEPDIDIREDIVLSEIMEKYNLGPNGAQIVASDLIALNINKIKNKLDTIDTDYVIIDTPGQIELFSFRSSSKVITDTLGKENAIIFFLIEPTLAKDENGFVSEILLSTTIQFRFFLPVVNVLSKIDLINNDDLKKIVSWAKDFQSLYYDFCEKKVPLYFLNFEIFKILENIGTTKTLIPVSSTEFFGFEDLYNIAQQLYASCEDLEKR